MTDTRCRCGQRIILCPRGAECEQKGYVHLWSESHCCDEDGQRVAEPAEDSSEGEAER